MVLPTRWEGEAIGENVRSNAHEGQSQRYQLLVAHDMSAWRAARVADHGKHGGLLEGRDGAGDESAGSDFTGDGETDHLVAGGGDRRHQRPLDAAVAGTLPGVWLRWAV